MLQMNLFKKQKQTHRLGERTSGYLGEGWGEETGREFGRDTWTLLYLKWITKKTYCIAQGTLPNVPCQPGWKRGLGRMEIHVHAWLSLRCLSETITTLLTGYTPIQNKKLEKRKGWLCRGWSPQLPQTRWMNSTDNHVSLQGDLELQTTLQPPKHSDCGHWDPGQRLELRHALTPDSKKLGAHKWVLF